jgi:branched-chain amino acid transport system permease protein
MTNFLIYASTMIGIWVVLALSLNIQFGLTGLVNFGQILPFAVGAYVEGIIELSGLPIWTGPIFVLIVSPLIGILVIFPAKQLAQDYWALITLGAGEIFRLIMLNYPSIAGGTEGVSVDRINDRMLAMILAVALAVAVYMISLWISRSPFGRFLRVIREDEVLGACLGRDPFSYQIKVMMISWAMAGLAGALYAHVTGFIHPSGFMVTETLIIWTAVILGGPGRNLGVVLGAVAVQLMTVSTRFVAQWSGLPSELVANLRTALIGLILVLMVVYRPQGLLPERKKDYDIIDK